MFTFQNPRDGDRSGNVPAGTVVDQGVTSTTDFDFYLNSHQGIQGWLTLTNFLVAELCFTVLLLYLATIPFRIPGADYLRLVRK